MSYIIRQKIRGRIYLYEVTATWDPVKKNSVQKRVYLGAEDANTKEPLPKKSHTPRTAFDYGNYHLFRSVADQIGLSRCLKNTMDDDDWENILNLAIFKLTANFNFSHYEHWCDVNLVRQALGSPDISRLLEKIEQHRIPFIKEWVKLHPEKEAVYFDLTSISTYSHLVDYAEWGYNRDKEPLPQINLGVVYAEQSQYPITYSFYSGSISDVKTLTNIVNFAQELGLIRIVFILDCGFYSQQNIEEMKENGLKFIIRMRPDLKIYEELISKFKPSSMQAFGLKKCSYYHKKVNIKIGKTKVAAHIYHDNNRYQDELNSFLNKLSEMEDLILAKCMPTAAEVETFLKDNNFKQYFNVMENGTVLRNQKEVDSHIKTLGKFILIAEDPLPEGKVILECYRKRDCSEKGFHGFKNSIGTNRLRTHSNNTTLGTIFISFISLILYSHAIKVLKNSKLNLPAVISSLNTFRAFKYTNNKLSLGELSKKNKQIFELFKIPIPAAPCY